MAQHTATAQPLTISVAPVVRTALKWIKRSVIAAVVLGLVWCGMAIGFAISGTRLAPVAPTAAAGVATGPAVQDLTPPVVADGPGVDPLDDVNVNAVSAATTKAPRACHTAYTVFAHVVPTHVVKATSKHSAYTVLQHTVAEHVVKANCPTATA